MRNIKKNQTELKNTTTEMKNTLEGINSRLDNTEEWISKLKDKVVEIIESIKRNEDDLRGKFWKSSNSNLICLKHLSVTLIWGCMYHCMEKSFCCQ